MLLRLVKKRLSSRPDAEHVMCVNRVVFSCFFLTYLALARPPGYDYGLAVSALGMVLTLAIFLHLLRYPAANPARRMVALLADVSVTCYDMHIGGSSTGLFYPLLLWIILGNGLRFGIGSLTIATLLGVLAFTLVVVSTPFWYEHASLSVGLIAGLVLIPIYAGALLKSLSRAKIAAEAANEAKTAFLASVSHELRTPLHAIIASGSLLQQDAKPAERGELTGTIMQASKALLALIDDLLNYSQIEAGGLRGEATPFALPDLLLNVRDMLLAAAERKGLRFALHIDPGTPRALRGDRRHIEQILLNLVGNAIKFTSFGGVLVSAGAVRAEGGMRLRLQVTDTGIGVPPEAHARIFERFTQADASIGSRFGGTGLGLAICRRLVEQLGGAIGLNSQPGSGSTFWFELPVAEIPDQDTAAWPDQVIALGLHEADAQQLAAAAREYGAALGTAGFERLDAALLRSSAQPGGPLLLAAPANPTEAEALIAAARALTGSALPALIMVGTQAAKAEEARWIAPTLLPAGFTPEALADAVAAVLSLARAARPTEAAPLAPSVRPLRVLVADDNKLNQRVVGAILDAGGHHHDTVADGEAALDALQVNEYDVVLMDVNMPGIDGLEATRLYRVMELGQPHLPIIGVTADATPEAAERCREAGMDRCVVKPVTAQELLAAIAQVVPMAASTATDAPPEGAPAPDVLGEASAQDARTTGAKRLRTVEEVVLDEARLRDLGALGGDGFVTDLLHGFAGDAAELVENIASALLDNNWPAFRASAHAVASSAANLGAFRVHHLANGMERMGPTGMKSCGRAKVAELRRELERLRQAAAEFAGSSVAPGTLAVPAPTGGARASGGGPAAAHPLGHSAAS